MDKKENKALIWLLDTVLNLAIILGLVLVIQTWIIAPFDVYGSSMCNTLNYIKDECRQGFGEKIIINEALYLFNEPERGDIVVFRSRDEEKKYFIKRVIGIPGDKVKIENGNVLLQKPNEPEFKVLEEPYLNEYNHGNTHLKFDLPSPFVVPEGHYFLLGDNRYASTDSRTCFFSNFMEAQEKCRENPELAFIESNDIRGKAWVVWWPLNQMRVLDHEEYSESLEEK